MRFLKYLFLLTFIGFLTVSVAQQGQNPIFRNAFTADPAPMVHDGTLYVYVGHDEATGNQLFNITEWLCYSTTDMINWESHGSIMKPTDFSWAVGEAWASQVIEHNGKFYFYTTVQAGNPNYGKAIGVAVADSPLGPFVDARGSALVYERTTPSDDVWDDIDPTVWVDDDGTAWMMWGNPNTYLAKLKPNMTEIDGEIMTIDLPYYAEGPWLWKHNGLYYVMYPAFVPPVGGEQMCYATATNIQGPWTYHGVVSPAARNSYTIHPGVVEYKGHWYMFYHNATLTLNGLGPATGRRSVCVEYMCYNEDGTIQYMPHTTEGVTLPPPCPTGGSISITKPALDTMVIIPTEVTIAAEVSDPESATTVEFFVNGEQFGTTEWVAPYEKILSIMETGVYEITAVVTDDQGNQSTSNVRTIRANVPQGPYEGNVHPIPGTIQLVEFDVGGNGNAYYDDTEGSETGVAFRNNEDVDIENCTDAGGGYNIGWATSGEWLEYTVDVQAAGLYALEIRAACNGADRTLSVEMDGEAIARDVAIPNTAGWQTWQTITVENIVLMPGEKVMRLSIGETDFVNLNYVTFNLIEEYVQEPYNGSPHAIPGRIEAEEYDFGREGLGYHEANANGNQGNADFRGDEVDIETTGDTDGEYNIAYTLTGEWLAYTVNVAQTGLYDIELRVARDGANGSLHIEMDGNNVTGAIAVPNTGAWQTYQTITVEDVNLTAGEQEMRIYFDTDYMNLNYVVFTAVIQDADNDGTPDNEDACPNDPNKADTEGDCGCGVADTDADADGIVDCNDEYPDDADNDGTNTAEDCDDNNPDISLAYTWYADTDADGVGVATNSVESCTQPTGYVETFGDECPDDENKTLPGDCGCGATEESCLDCAGIPNGTAEYDDCGVCDGNNACVDCNGEPNGDATEDACGTCAGGGTGITPVTNPQECIATGIDEGYLNELKVYPNPTTGILHLPEATNWKLTDMKGRLLQEGNSSLLNMGDVQEGLYLLYINGEMVKIVKK